MAILKSLKSASFVHDTVPSATAWARMVESLAAEKKKKKLELKQRGTQQAIKQQSSSRR